jgi:hypothetical protein
VQQIAPGFIGHKEAEEMSKLKTRPGSRIRFAIGDLFMFDANELLWIALAVGAVLLYAHNIGG